MRYAQSWRAERRLGELIAAEQEAGRLATQDTGAHREVSTVRTLADHNIPRNRSAMDPADVLADVTVAAMFFNVVPSVCTRREC